MTSNYQVSLQVKIIFLNKKSFHNFQLILWQCDNICDFGKKWILNFCTIKLQPSCLSIKSKCVSWLWPHHVASRYLITFNKTRFSYQKKMKLTFHCHIGFSMKNVLKMSTNKPSIGSVNLRGENPSDLSTHVQYNCSHHFKAEINPEIFGTCWSKFSGLPPKLLS